MSYSDAPLDRTRTRRIFALAVFLLVVVVDSVSKVLVKALIATGGPFELFSFLNIVLVYNKGIAFGILSDAPLSPVMMAVVSFIIGGAFVTIALFEQTALRALSLAAIGGGGFANGLDRLLNDAVVDFLDVHLAGWHFYTFNIADCAITLGVVAYFLSPPPPPNKSSLPSVR